MFNQPGSCTELCLACGCVCTEAPAAGNETATIQCWPEFLPQYLVFSSGYLIKRTENTEL